jgi:hypothetical protein
VLLQAYLEFFTPAFNVERILHVVKKHPHITFHAINADVRRENRGFVKLTPLRELEVSYCCLASHEF